MILTLADWQFQVDWDETQRCTRHCSEDHCTCAYCRNFYENIDLVQPSLRPVLERFGIYLDGPCEVMPFEPTLLMACYRVTGKILRTGESRLHVDGVILRPEPGDEKTFLLWVGELELPWTQYEDMDEVISPANQPEFLDRMYRRWLETRDTGNQIE